MVPVRQGVDGSNPAWAEPALASIESVEAAKATIEKDERFIMVKTADMVWPKDPQDQNCVESIVQDLMSLASNREPSNTCYL